MIHELDFIIPEHNALNSSVISSFRLCSGRDLDKASVIFASPNSGLFFKMVSYGCIKTCSKASFTYSITKHWPGIIHHWWQMQWSCMHSVTSWGTIVMFWHLFGLTCSTSIWIHKPIFLAAIRLLVKVKIIYSHVFTLYSRIHNLQLYNISESLLTTICLDIGFMYMYFLGTTL